jgi:hypothetical protein
MSTYDETKRRKDLEYTQSYRQWVAKMSPSQRRKLEEQGLAEPRIDRLRTSAGNDIEDLPLASPPNEAQSEERLDVGPRVLQGQAGDVLEVLRRLLGELMAQSNMRLTVECLALVTGLSYSGNSMSEIAKRHRVTRAAVSKRCIAITEALGLPPSRAMRALTARSAYERRQHRILHRNERFGNDPSQS